MPTVEFDLWYEADFRGPGPDDRPRRLAFAAAPAAGNVVEFRDGAGEPLGECVVVGVTLYAARPGTGFTGPAGRLRMAPFAGVR